VTEKSIHDLLNKPPIMEFEGFILRPFDGWHLWFEHPDGSGTQLRKDKFLGVLIRLFKETM
jgi:hypothetical protein